MTSFRNGLKAFRWGRKLAMLSNPACYKVINTFSTFGKYLERTLTNINFFLFPGLSNIL
jgi:hypothetical protein